jgi:hypothetical protein
VSRAQEFISALDGALAIAGEDVRLQRLTGTQLIPFEVECRAAVRNYDAKELIGPITQDQSEVILSPTEIIRKSWPGPQILKAGSSPQAPTTQDRRVPIKGDKVVIAGKPRAIEVSTPKYVDGELVRITLRVLG